MTKKVVHLWEKFNFWDKIRMTLGAVGIGGEVTLFIADSYPKWKIVAASCTIAMLAITYLFKDENKNGIIDIAE